MMRIGDLFRLKSARSTPFNEHEPGEIAFVTNGYRDNGVLGRVQPDPADRVFRQSGICVSAFCEATVPEPPFIARGNGGSGLTVLIPKAHMAATELLGYASYISQCHGWKFSFGRMATGARLAGLPIPETSPAVKPIRLGSLLPQRIDMPCPTPENLRFSRVCIADLFKVKSGDFHSVSELSPGTIPLVSCGIQDNGIIGFYSPPPDMIYRDRLTVAYNGDYPLMAKFHPYTFAAKDDVAILEPHTPLGLASILFIQLLLNREVWRHSYGRKLYRTRLAKFELAVPIDDDGSLDGSGITGWFEANPLWADMRRRLEVGLPSLRRATLDLMSDSGG